MTIEIWRPVAGYETLYHVSNCGRVWSVRSRRALRPGVASNGYPTVALSGKTHTVHSLVATAFLGPRPEGQQVRHVDGDRENPDLTNLEYGTPAQNNADKDRHGTKLRGSRYRNAKLTEEAARHIRAAKGRISQSKLAEMYGVSPAAVQAVHDGRTWTHA